MRALHINKIPIQPYTSYEELSFYRHHHQSLSCHKKHKAIIVSPQRRWFCATFRISFQVRYMAFRWPSLLPFPLWCPNGLVFQKRGAWRTVFHAGSGMWLSGNLTVGWDSPHPIVKFPFYFYSQRLGRFGKRRRHQRERHQVYISKKMAICARFESWYISYP